MRWGKREITALVYASVFAFAVGAALYFFARAQAAIAILSAAVLFAACLVALLAEKR